MFQQPWVELWSKYISINHLFEQTPGKPGMLKSIGSQKVRHDWVTKKNNKNHYYLILDHHLCYVIQIDLHFKGHTKIYSSNSDFDLKFLYSVSFVMQILSASDNILTIISH